MKLLFTPSVTINPFESQWELYVPAVLTLQNPTFCPREFMWSHAQEVHGVRAQADSTLILPSATSCESEMGQLPSEKGAHIVYFFR
jgi:hypothetical protein